jgi:hypothetical protein
VRLLSRSRSGAFEDATTAKAKFRATAGESGAWGAMSCPFLEKPEALNLKAVSRKKAYNKSICVN